MTDEEVIMIGLASVIVHLLEYQRVSGRPLDLLAAQALLNDSRVRDYLDGIDSVFLPLPRDGVENRFRLVTE